MEGAAGGNYLDGTTESGSWLAFETLNFVPIDVEAIDSSLLTSEELNWINQYHRKVYDRLHPEMNKEEATWLQKVTAPLK
ncbi:MAG: M24 family metallopeptidase C-terminal domain-containing protein [Candidatus Cloacimonetes bacterium]|nr:M24 family metallopeptidase C-terminal domain-containing protein [Candidatus Cloacimonadota bacterium]